MKINDAIVGICKLFVAFCMIGVTLQGALALASDFTPLGSCYAGSTSTQVGVSDNRSQLTIVESCVSSNEIDFTQEIELSLGVLQPGDVIIQKDAIYVDSSLRPDLDANATLTFADQQFAVTPSLLRDGSVCGAQCSGAEYVDQTFTVNVTGFSNYSLTHKQDFTVYSDEQPELQGKIYQTVDLGSAYRSSEFACLVMIFADDRNGNLALVQTNPEREVQGRLFGDTDGNQPESLGYFLTKNGVANVYFRNDKLVGYTDFQYVVQCQSNTTQLVYEETINAVQRPLGRGFASWGVWLTTDNDGENAFFVVLYIIGGVLFLWVFLVFVRSLRWR